MVQAAARTRRPKPIYQPTPAQQSTKPSRLSVSPLSLRSPTLQPKLTVNTPGDKYEQEADAVASAVMHTPAPLPQPDAGRGSIQRMTAENEPMQRMAEEDQDVLQRLPSNEESVQRMVPQDEPVQRKGEGSPRVSPGTAATIRNPGSGSPLSPGIRHRVEPHVGANLSGVRVHTGPSAHRAAASLNARAFTHGNHIFLNRSESSHNLGLMAHESTHVVQQGAAPIQRQPIGSSLPVQADAPPTVQRLLPSVILEELDEYARYIPGYSLFTVIIGFNPLTGQDVERNATNLLEGLMGLAPFGTFVFDKLQEYGILDAVFAWVEGELNRLDLSVARIERTIEAAWDDVSLIEGFDYNLAVLERHFGALYNDVVAFAESLINHIIELIKEAAIDFAEPLLAENQAWALIKKIIKYNPLRDQPVDASTVEILSDFLLLIGKEQELQQMQERGTLQETADWLDTQFATFMALLGELRGLVMAAWDAIQPENLPNLTTNLQTLAVQAGSFLQRVWDFALTVALKVLELIKHALLSWLSTFANDIPGYHLLTVILEQDPFTQEEVPRNATNLIRGFMSLMPGGEQQFQQMQESGVIPQAAQRIEGAMTELGITWPFVQQLFLDLWNAFTIDDLLSPIDAFTRVLNQFQEPLNRLFTFVIEVIKVVLELILALMNFPTDLIGSIIANAMQALDDIQRDPVGFLINLLETAKLGFQKFFDNIVTHLISGLTDWLFRTVRDAGLEPPTDLSFESILGFVLQVLGLTMDHMWELLANHIGQERVDQIRGAIDRVMEIAREAWGFIQDVQERGIVAVWEYIQSQLTNLWDVVLEQVKSYVMERVINVGMRWLMSLLDVTGITPVINSFVAFFNAIQSAIEYLRDMLEIVNNFVSTVASIAAGDIEPGAARMEQGLGNSIPIVIGFIANQLGLGNISQRLGEIIQSIRGMVDQALNWLIEQALRIGGSLLELGRGAVGAIREWWRNRRPVGEGEEAHTVYFRGEEDTAEIFIESSPRQLSRFIDAIKTDSRYQVPTKQAAIAEVETKVTELTTLLRERRQAKQANQTSVVQQKDTDIEAAFGIIITKLDIVFSGGNDPYGTRQDPIPLAWPGPNSINYSPLYFGGRLPTDKRPKSQAAMQALYSSNTLDETGTQIQEYKPHERKTLPGGGTIGLTPEFYVSSGSIVGPLTTETTEGGGQLERLILPYGFSGADDGMDLDHVHEVQFGGLAQNDKVENLWPLASSINRSKGSRLSRATVEYPRGVQTTISVLKNIQTDDVRNRRKFFFQIQ